MESSIFNEKAALGGHYWVISPLANCVWLPAIVTEMRHLATVTRSLTNATARGGEQEAASKCSHCQFPIGQDDRKKRTARLEVSSD